ncbi:NAD-glutamate dehydrogenase domain-containing protein [Parachlamydia sp. AcF125]|uniref:NAD-glutamate dehydrogenase domain-containing protein n=1 Tax=Parachlamydia sp. AcF125 TaxID=2795736 RepID=UPI001BC92C5F|nr:NAD-glutamate dehydrogenase domain-containing protein [Parachlamydia sp. AcF125]MBS4168201.1 NAD-specific glutamate dehydrogenase [Parachlamydia sp. AcF125]
MERTRPLTLTHEQLEIAVKNESQKFQGYYQWLEQAMPHTFFEDISEENIMLITHSLMGFHVQEFFSTIQLKHAAIVMCLDSADADLRILKDYALYGIKNYQTYVSKMALPFPGVSANLRVASLYFTEAIEPAIPAYPQKEKEELRALVKERNPQVSDEEFERLLSGINNRFLRALPVERLILALGMFFRAKTRDNCQYEVRYNEDWQEKGVASMQIVLAWRNTPKYHFLYRLARTIQRHGLVMKSVNACYIDPYSKNSILLMVLSLHGSNGEAAWDVADIPNFLREFVTVKYFPSFDEIDQQLISKGVVTGAMGNFLRASVSFIHQCLVHLDAHLYTPEKIEEDLCRHPELTQQICLAFKNKFDPDDGNLEEYLKIRTKFLEDVANLDTGHEENDLRRKNVLRQGMNLVHYCYKTNFYRVNYTALSFRMDPHYLDEIPFERQKKFPELPFAIIFSKGMHFLGFHIRFKDLARGGLRTVFPSQAEHMVSEGNRIFTECYSLAYTQHKKNKDIPEGGAKGVLFINPYERLDSETQILRKELEASQTDPAGIEENLALYRKEQAEEFLYQAQRSYIESLLTIVNCHPDGSLRAKYIVDYWQRPEYIYLGPDENMHDSMIQWIAAFSRKYGYKPGGAFISGKPIVGINHKEYGVTSLGVNVYMEALLHFIGIDPTKEQFTVKMSGGPDGDVAGNQICNLYRYFPHTAKLLALTDVSGTIHDPQGLDLACLAELFKERKPIRYYPPNKLNEGGFLVDKESKRNQTAFIQQVLCWKKQEGKLIEDWISGSEMNHLLRHNVHQAKTDVFIPAGGRPRTLNHSNVEDFLDDKGSPTSRLIIEGANLYLTPQARRFLEEKEVLIVKDSSANKTGVICSSFEILCGLTLTDEEFITYKSQLAVEILERLKKCASEEARLLLRTLEEQGGYLTDISELISKRINQFTYQLLDFLEEIELSKDLNDPLIRRFLRYCLPTLRQRFQHALLQEIPEHHKKAIIACSIAADLVYSRGISWLPSVVDVLPLLLEQKEEYLYPPRGKALEAKEIST